MVEADPAHAAQEAVLVPANIRYAHQVSIVDLLAAALADLVVFLTFYSDICGRKRGIV